MAVDDQLQRHLGDLPFKVKRKLVVTIKDEAERLASAIRAKAPRGKTGNLAASVKVRRKRNELDLEVTAGGKLTTKFYNRSTGYEREVVIDGRSNEGIAKRAGGAGVSYDYALASEHGTQKEPAQPFFYSTARRLMPSIQQNIQDAVEEALK